MAITKSKSRNHSRNTKHNNSKNVSIKKKTIIYSGKKQRSMKKNMVMKGGARGHQPHEARSGPHQPRRRRSRSPSRSPPPVPPPRSRSPPPTYSAHNPVGPPTHTLRRQPSYTNGNNNEEL